MGDGPSRVRIFLKRLANPKLPLVLAGIVLIGGIVGSLVMMLIEPKAPIQLADKIAVEAPIPPVPEPLSEPAREEVPAPPAIASTPPPPEAPPVDPLPELLTESEFGPIPRGNDNSSSWSRYRRSSGDLSRSGRIAILITDLGLDGALTEAASSLPPTIDLGFSPYGADNDAWMRYARWRGHEVFTMLTLEPVAYPRIDPGPATLFFDATEDEFRHKLRALMSRGQGYLGFAGEAGKFADDPARFRFVAQDLASHGLGLVELGGDHLKDVALEYGVPYSAIDIRLDEDLAPASIEAKLAALVNEALRSGQATAYSRPYPLIFNLINQWSETLEDKGLALAPISAVLADPSH